jgi:hypothetical protein
VTKHSETKLTYDAKPSPPAAFDEPVRYDRSAVLTTPLLPGLSLSLEKVLGQPG